MTAGRQTLLLTVVLWLFATSAAASTLNDTARYLAGKSRTSTESYTAYASEIRAGWEQLQPNLERMRTWWTHHQPAKYSTVFYPFGGPDIANALVLFPDADTYILFGLEAPGEIPDLASLDEAAITAGLNDLKASLSTSFQVNYFFTKAMEKKLGKGAFNSVSGLLLFFLAMSDCEVTNAKPIGLGKSITGIEITFRRDRGKPQTIRYFMTNVADAKLSPELVKYLEGERRFVTMIKSASYLMHKEAARETTRFDKIRTLILERSDFIVQDDSAIPLRWFARDTWKLKFHGKYDAPTPEFQRYLQRDLKVEMQRNSTGKLPFSYGYAYKQGESNLMTAERAR